MLCNSFPLVVCAEYTEQFSVVSQSTVYAEYTEQYNIVYATLRRYTT